MPDWIDPKTPDFNAIRDAAPVNARVTNEVINNIANNLLYLYDQITEVSTQQSQLVLRGETPFLGSLLLNQSDDAAPSGNTSLVFDNYRVGMPVRLHNGAWAPAEVVLEDSDSPFNWSYGQDAYSTGIVLKKYNDPVTEDPVLDIITAGVAVFATPPGYVDRFSSSDLSGNIYSGVLVDDMSLFSDVFDETCLVDPAGDYIVENIQEGVYLLSSAFGKFSKDQKYTVVMGILKKESATVSGVQVTVLRFFVLPQGFSGEKYHVHAFTPLAGVIGVNPDSTINDVPTHPTSTGVIPNNLPNTAWAPYETGLVDTPPMYPERTVLELKTVVEEVGENGVGDSAKPQPVEWGGTVPTNPVPADGALMLYATGTTHTYRSGWLSVKDSYFTDNPNIEVPEGAVFGYTVRNLSSFDYDWPPSPLNIPLSSMCLMSDGAPVPESYYTIDKFGIWWMKDGYEHAPFPTRIEEFAYGEDGTVDVSELEKDVKHLELLYVKTVSAQSSGTISSLSSEGAAAKRTDVNGVSIKTPESLVQIPLAQQLPFDAWQMMQDMLDIKALLGSQDLGVAQDTGGSQDTGGVLASMLSRLMTMPNTGDTSLQSPWTLPTDKTLDSLVDTKLWEIPYSKLPPEIASPAIDAVTYPATALVIGGNPASDKQRVVIQLLFLPKQNGANSTKVLGGEGIYVRMGKYVPNTSVAWGHWDELLYRGTNNSLDEVSSIFLDTYANYAEDYLLGSNGISASPTSIYLDSSDVETIESEGYSGVRMDLASGPRLVARQGETYIFSPAQNNTLRDNGKNMVVVLPEIRDPKSTNLTPGTVSNGFSMTFSHVRGPSVAAPPSRLILIPSNSKFAGVTTGAGLRIPLVSSFVEEELFAASSTPGYTVSSVTLLVANNQWCVLGNTGYWGHPAAPDNITTPLLPSLSDTGQLVFSCCIPQGFAAQQVVSAIATALEMGATVTGFKTRGDAVEVQEVVEDHDCSFTIDGVFTAYAGYADSQGGFQVANRLPTLHIETQEPLDAPDAEGTIVNSNGDPVSFVGFVSYYAATGATTGVNGEPGHEAAILLSAPATPDSPGSTCSTESNLEMSLVLPNPGTKYTFNIACPIGVASYRPITLFEGNSTRKNIEEICAAYAQAGMLWHTFSADQGSAGLFSRVSLEIEEFPDAAEVYCVHNNDYDVHLFLPDGYLADFVANNQVGYSETFDCTAPFSSSDIESTQVLTLGVASYNNRSNPKHTQAITYLVGDGITDKFFSDKTSGGEQTNASLTLTPNLQVTFTVVSDGGSGNQLRIDVSAGNKAEYSRTAQLISHIVDAGVDCLSESNCFHNDATYIAAHSPQVTVGGYISLLRVDGIPSN